MLEDKLERLADAFEGHGIAVRANLAPGASDEELDHLAESRGVELPEDYRTLYRWHNGNIDHWSADLFVFRDNPFIRIDEFPRAQMYIDGYRALESDPSLPKLDVDLSGCVPFAEFDGSVYVIPCKGQTMTTLSAQPVICLFEDVSVHFLSIESMIDTCIEWVEQPGYTRYGTAPNEREIWSRNNPGLR